MQPTDSPAAAAKTPVAADPPPRLTEKPGSGSLWFSESHCWVLLNAAPPRPRSCCGGCCGARKPTIALIWRLHLKITHNHHDHGSMIIMKKIFIYIKASPVPSSYQVVQKFRLKIDRTPFFVLKRVQSFKLLLIICHCQVVALTRYLTPNLLPSAYIQLKMRCNCEWKANMHFCSLSLSLAHTSRSA